MTDSHNWAVNIIEEGCTNEDTRCFGTDLYECQNNEWVLIEENSPRCTEFDWWPIIVAAGAIGAVGIGGAAVYAYKKKSRGKK